MDDVLNDALSNLEHDNYERSHKGYENRQADIALIRAALADPQQRGGDDLSGVKPPMRHIAGVNVDVLRRAAQAENSAKGAEPDIQEKLKDPNVVHVNMLRGTIAPITFDQLAHILGDEATAKWVADRQQRGGDVDERAVVGTPRYKAWLHLRTHGQWPDDIPEWAKDHNGHMNDMVAARAVVEELAVAALAAQPAVSAEPSDAVVRDATGETWLGMRVTGWTWVDDMPDPPYAGGKIRRFATHWSTGPQHAERLYRESDIRALLSRYGMGNVEHCSGDAQPYAYEYGRSNGDGTFSVVIERGQPRNPVKDWPVKPLYAEPMATQKADDVRDAERWRELDRVASDPDFDLKCDAGGWNFFKGQIDAAIAQQESSHDN